LSRRRYESEVTSTAAAGQKRLAFAFVLVGCIAGVGQAQQAVTISLTAATGVTAIPDGTGTFIGYPPDPCISFGSVATLGTYQFV
jgi:hypothetical protein